MAKKKKKRRRHKPTARPQRMVDLALNILAGIISGLLVLAFQKLTNQQLEGAEATTSAPIIK